MFALRKGLGTKQVAFSIVHWICSSSEHEYQSRSVHQALLLNKAWADRKIEIGAKEMIGVDDTYSEKGKGLVALTSRRHAVFKPSTDSSSGLKINMRG